MRVVCHMLAGGNPADLPPDINKADYIGPPGPAAEFAHDPRAIAKGDRWQEGVGYNEEGPYAFHKQMCQLHNIGIETTSGNRSSETRTRNDAQRVSEWSLQAMAGAPVMALMLERTPKLLTGLVRCLMTPLPCS